MSIASKLIKQIDSIYEGYGKDNKYRNMVEGPKNNKGNIVNREEVEKDPDRYFKKNNDGLEELREYLTDITEEALSRTKQGGNNKYGFALNLVQKTDNDILKKIEARIQEIAKSDRGLPPIKDMPDGMIRRILKG